MSQTADPSGTRAAPAVDPAGYGPAEPGLVHRLLHPEAPRRVLDLNPIGLGLAVGGFGLALIASLLPWAVLTGVGGPEEDVFGNNRRQIELSLGSSGDGYLAAYHLLWGLLLVSVVLALAGPARLRKPAAIGGLGAGAGLLLVLASLANALVTLALGQLYLTGGSDSVDSTLREGIYCGALAAALTIAALFFAPLPRTRAGRQPSAAHRPAAPYPPPYAGPGPYGASAAPAQQPIAVYDLTVSSAGPVAPVAPSAPEPAPNPYGGGAENPWNRDRPDHRREPAG